MTARPPEAAVPLDEYRRKRRFDKTPEPDAVATSKTKGRRAAGPSFVVQKHAASRLHYDFRLEHDGVLVSWAVPKGPSLDPSQKRLAVKVEDHPLAYGGFEGSIPAGEYGGGEVIVWDRGTWEPDGDAADMLDAGRLRFRLAGEKLEGSWSLVRAAGRMGDKNWLLIKVHDAAAVPEAEGNVLVDRPESVLSGRTLHERPAPTRVSTRSHAPRGTARPRRSASHHPDETTAGTPATRPRKKAETESHQRKSRSDQDQENNEDEPVTAVGVRLTHPDKVFYPAAGVSKAELAAYVVAVADQLLAEVEGRPLALVRCPDGLGGERFFQKHPGKWMPEAVVSFDVDGEPKPWIGVRDGAGLVSLVQTGALELHPWGSRVDRPDRPDRMTVDLDPGEGVAWEQIVAAASLVRTLLDEAGLVSFAKTTGGKGLHVVVPLARRQGWNEVTEFAKRFATKLAEDRPKEFTAASAKAARAGRIYVDYLRNGRGATAVAAYSPRAREGATVATPVSWDELSRGLASDSFTVRTVPGRLKSLKADPWPGFEVRQSITAKVRRAVGI